MAEDKIQSMSVVAVNEEKSKPRKNQEGSSKLGNNKNASNKKRKRDAGGKKKWQLDQENYYNRLLHGATKDLKKQAKIVRTFECQKMVRKIKDCKPTNNGSQQSQNTEEAYQQLKSLDLDSVVQESLRRLGILLLNPKLTEDSRKDQKDENGDDTKLSDNSANGTVIDCQSDKTKELKIPTGKCEQLVEKILKHKKMLSTIENWNDQVTEYRRWSLQQQDRDAPKFGHESQHTGKKKKRRSSNKEYSAADVNEDPDKSLFLRLDGGDHDEPAEGEKKKNRRGQRARKAKAMAIEAKKAGRVRQPDDSLNWRPKKQQKPTQEEGGDYRKNSQPHHQFAAGDPSHSERTKPAPATTEKLHPSWAAAKKETSGIVKFQGTKITF